MRIEVDWLNNRAKEVKHEHLKVKCRVEDVYDLKCRELYEIDARLVKI